MNLCGQSSEFNKNNYQIIMEDKCIFVKGSLTDVEYSDLESFLKSIQENERQEITIDFTKADFINSSGIRIFAQFFIKIKISILIKIDKELEWQCLGIAPLSRITPNGRIKLEYV